MKRLLNLEKRFNIETNVHKNYCIFMNKYLDKGHMEKISKGEIQKSIN